MRLPRQTAAPLHAIIDARSISSREEARAQRLAAKFAGPATASQLPEDKRPLYRPSRDRPGPYFRPNDSAGEPVKTMQLWRDVVRSQPLCKLQGDLPIKCCSLPLRKRVLLGSPHQDILCDCSSITLEGWLACQTCQAWSLTCTLAVQRTGQYFRLITNAAADRELQRSVQPPPRQKALHGRHAQPNQMAAPGNVYSNDERAFWSADPVRSTCSIQ